MENKFLAHVDTKRMNWYLDRDLAIMLNEYRYQSFLKGAIQITWFTSRREKLQALFIF